MRKILCLLIILASFPLLYAQSAEIKELNRKMTEIRRNTNWEDANAARRANEEIRRLSRELQLLKQRVNTQNPSKTDEINRQNVEANAKTFGQILDAFEKGEQADILLGEPVREEIIEEYKDDDSPIIKSNDYLNQTTLLVIDMSLKTVQRTIDQMEKFTSIKTLVIYCSGSPSPVNLRELLKKAKDYPLEELYIMNFQNFVNSLPGEVGNFRNLNLLSLIRNKIRALPPEVNSLTSLKELYVDTNPVSAMAAVIGRLKNLETLGAVMTNLNETEINKIKQLLPKCKIITR